MIGEIREATEESNGWRLRLDRTENGDLQRLPGPLGEALVLGGAVDGFQRGQAPCDPPRVGDGEVGSGSAAAVQSDDRSRPFELRSGAGQDVGLGALIVGAGIGDFVLEGAPSRDGLRSQYALQALPG